MDLSRSSCVALVALALFGRPARAQDEDLSGRYHIDGVARDATRTTGELTLRRDGDAYFAERTVETFPGRHACSLTGNAYRMADGGLEVDLEPERGFVGALGGGSAPRAIARYHSDGRGGLVGSYGGPEGTYEETLAPEATGLPGDAAAIGSAGLVLATVGQDPVEGAGALADAVRAQDALLVDQLVAGYERAGILGAVIEHLPGADRDALARLGIGDAARDELAAAAIARHHDADMAHFVRELAETARASSVTSARVLVDDLVAHDALYAALGAASPDDRHAIAAIASAVSPVDPSPAANVEFERAFREVSPQDLARSETQLLIVPGFTPTGAAPLHEIDPTAQARCARAAEDFRRGRAPFILVSGGAVHPESSPVVEALELEAELVRLGVPANRIAVDGRARHSTTNLRNAGRFMLAHGIAEAEVVTSAGQSFYFSDPHLSTFDARCRRELGYEVGSLRFRDIWHTDFRPSPECTRVNAEDPFDP